MKRLILPGLCALLLAGCAAVQTCDEGGRTMVDISNSGWYLLGFIPLASGSPDNPNGHTCRLLRQTTTLDNNMKLLDYAIHRTPGATGYRNLVSYTTDENVLFILFKRHVCHSSAEVVIAADSGAGPLKDPLKEETK